MTRTFLALVALVAAGCASRIDAASFDQSCTTDDDCVAVFTGDVCEEPRCGCSNDAVNVGALADYQAAREAIACGPAASPVQCACPEATPFCRNGTCDADP